jgi:hypothetical protein
LVKVNNGRFILGYFIFYISADFVITDVETEYGCVFGLSNRTNDLKEGQIYQVHTFDRMLGLVMGQNDDIYWFHFFRAPKKHTGMDLPRYTEKDVERLLAEDGHRIVKDGTTFNDIFNNRKTHVITPLPTHTFQGWHYKRIICLGDAVAKVSAGFID